ncbi:NAD(P)-dependent dehydrogenase (short-subunit alcohol dehydrogenase family) [Paraburkholderia silvatlantica]|uniref:NAD(P)-dependent dehydrogenase (Short-subunit alcohol dehydrogenase family) n=1 Tax=Paraburkholderia silvatlantica TaxID=321895 RepID=A0ABR6FGR3_9BURK|nr:NAD(P)-dependent dehydrogenase (short-subunit alcohol dehydrogenase family) [Paraburkholderia silvatlantica]
MVATLRKPGTLDDLKTQHGERLKIVACDVTDSEAIRAAVADAFATRERIDVVVSNAGYGLFGAAEELGDAQIERQIATNLTGSIQLIRAAIARLREQGGGRIVQVSSEGGQIAYPGFSAYHATKWGIEGFVEAVAQEVAAFGIDFVIVAPGPTRTNFGAGLDRAAPLDAYDSTPVRELRRTIDAGYFEFADAGKTVDAMLAAIDSPSPPFRVALGRSAYESVRAALIKRLAVLEPQKAVALSVMEHA